MKNRHGTLGPAFWHPQGQLPNSVIPEQVIHLNIGTAFVAQLNYFSSVNSVDLLIHINTVKATPLLIYCHTHTHTHTPIQP